MKKEQLSGRVTVYEFTNHPDYVTYALRIDGKRHIYIVDTGFGPPNMEQTQGYPGY